MMTLKQIRDKVKLDLSMQEEAWLSDAECDSYINDAINECEAEIHGTCEDYFLTQDNISLSTGASEYSMPVDIYANKIRKMYYAAGEDKYLIRRIKKLEDIANFQGEEPYSYVLINKSNLALSNYDIGTYQVTFTYPHNLIVGNSVTIYQSDKSTLRGSDTVATVVDAYNIILTTGITDAVSGDVLRVFGTKIKLYPASRETSTSNVNIWYIRTARELVNDGDVCDIPEFVQFVIQHAKVSCLKKDIGNPMIQTEMQQLEAERERMTCMLSNMVVDDDNFVDKDLSFYEDFDTFIW